MLKSLIYRLSIRSARHPWWVLLAASVITALAIFASIHLPVYTSRQALLPQDTEVAHRLNRYLETFGASSDLVVVLESAPRPVLESFAHELANRLRTQPEIAQATDRIDTGFLHDHLYLILPPDQLAQLEQGLSAAVKMPKISLEGLLNSAASASTSEKPSGEVDLQKALIGIKGASAFVREWQRWLDEKDAPAEIDFDPILKTVGAEQLGKGYFSSHDGKMLLLFVHAKATGEDFETLAPFNQRINQVAAELSKEYLERGLTAPHVVLTGLPAIEYEEYIDIERDIKLVIWTAAGLIGALIFLVVRSVPWALAIFIPMGLGAVWSLGFAYVAVGHLTIITSSFLAILFGLGADYGIFTTSQIAEARRSGKPLIEAIGSGIRDSFSAVLTAGGASLLIFGTLSTVAFPGFAELGIIAAGGVLLILVSTWIVQPAIYALIPPKIRAKKTLSKTIKSNRKIPRWLALIVVILAGSAAALGIRSGLEMGFDYDVLALLPRDSKAAEYQRKMVTETDYQSEIVIFTAHTLDEIRRISEEAQKKPSIAKVQSISSFFPIDAAQRVDAAQRMAHLAMQPALVQNIAGLNQQGLDGKSFRSIQRLLQQSLEKIEAYEEQAFSSGNQPLVQGLEELRSGIESLQASLEKDPETARLRSEALLRALLAVATDGVEQVRDWTSARAISPTDLPNGLRERFVAGDGTLAAYAYPAKSVYDPVNLDELMTEVYQVSPEATGFPTTHQVFSKAVVSSFSQGTKAAILVCLAWLAFIIRSPRGILLATLPLVIGGGWMLGIMKLAGLHYNYANIIALPLVIALAVDYGVWLSHRWMAMKGEDPIAITKDAGRVILLAAGTELAGLGAITLASYRGVSGLGIDITIGLMTCLASTLFIAPAIGLILSSSRKK
ncbi:MAG TPA: hypothetical protein DCY52_08370 [Methylococcaceae bacterium]|nr:hypothetical protein [Methylococcaceae bacterium]